MLGLSPENVSLLIHAGIVAAGPSDGSRSSYFAFAFSAVIRTRNFLISFRMLWRSGPGGSLRAACNSFAAISSRSRGTSFSTRFTSTLFEIIPLHLQSQLYKAEAILPASRSRACRCEPAAGRETSRPMQGFIRMMSDRCSSSPAGGHCFQTAEAASVSFVSAAVVALGERSGT